MSLLLLGAGRQVLGGAAFSPAALSSPLGVWDSLVTETLFQDAAASSSATTSGQAVGAWVPIAGTVGNAIATVGTNNPNRIDVSGIPTVQFYGGGGYTTRDRLAVADFAEITPAAWSFHCLFRSNGTESASTPLISFNSATTQPFIAGRWAGGDNDARVYRTGSGAGSVSFSSIFNHWTQWRFFSVVFTGTEYRAYVDGRRIRTRVDSLNMPSISSLILGACPTYGGLVGNIAHISFYAAAQTHEEVLAYGNYIRQRFPTLLTRPQYRVLWVAASSASGDYVTNMDDTIPHRAMTGGTIAYDLLPRAMGGQSTTDFIGVVADEIIPHLGWATDRDVVVFWQASNNEMSSGMSGADAYANVRTLLSTIRASQARYVPVVVSNNTPRLASNQAQYYTDRATFNGLVTSGAGLGVDYDFAVDLASDPIVGPDGAQDNTTYYNADKVHMNDSGCAIAAPYFTPQIEAALTMVAP